MACIRQLKTAAKASKTMSSTITIIIAFFLLVSLFYFILFFSVITISSAILSQNVLDLNFFHHSIKQILLTLIPRTRKPISSIRGYFLICCSRFSWEANGSQLLWPSFTSMMHGLTKRRVTSSSFRYRSSKEDEQYEVLMRLFK